MAQGKLKVKTKGSVPASKKKHEKKPQNLKKGKHFIAPKKQVCMPPISVPRDESQILKEHCHTANIMQSMVK